LEKGDGQESSRTNVAKGAQLDFGPECKESTSVLMHLLLIAVA